MYIFAYIIPIKELPHKDYFCNFFSSKFSSNARFIRLIRYEGASAKNLCARSEFICTSIKTTNWYS